ncbi:MAG: hypothetical protein R6W87_12500 [Halospina sp.]
MDLRVKRTDMVAALRLVAGAVNATTQQPRYRCVELEADGDTCRLFGTDLEVALEINLPAEVDTPGSALVPHARLAPLVRATPDDELDLHLAEGHLELDSSDGVCRLLTETGDLPDPEPMAEPSASADAEALAWALRRGMLAVAQHRGRYALDGIRLELAADGPLTVISADGARLSRARRPVVNGYGLEMEITIPPPGAAAMVALANAAPPGGTVRFGLSDGKVANWCCNDGIIWH